VSYISIDHNDKRPPYEQISSSIIAMITDGSLGPGAQLAPIRQLAGDLGVAPNTVARAYRELEQAGLLASRGRRGTVVRALPVPTADDACTFAAAVDAARAAGLSAGDIIKLVSRALAGTP
jgi:GntR family transcriptional regulator